MADQDEEWVYDEASGEWRPASEVAAANAVEVRDELDVLSYAMYPAVFDEWPVLRPPPA